MLALTRFVLTEGFLRLSETETHASGASVWADHFVSKDSVSYFGVVIEGTATVVCGSGRFPLKAEMYFSCHGPLQLEGGRGLLIRVEHFVAPFLIGGPAEHEGRLRYVSGCTDSLLISPQVLGDPCLNFLHLPANTKQVMHTHPSLRAGVVLSGSGICKTPTTEVPLNQGDAFLIEPETAHAFYPNDNGLRVIAYHPDSDFGPQHENHPMINKTIVGGRSARDLPEVMTQSKDMYEVS